jgi:hypothetical protein
MATLAKNRITRSVRPGSIFESALSLISSAISWNQGDLLYLDTTNHLIKPVTGDTDALTILGIARNTILNGAVKGPYDGLADLPTSGIVEVAGPQFGVVAYMKLKTGDVFVAGQSIYASSVDAQTVSASGTNVVGIFQDSGLTAAASSQGNVLIGAKGAGVLQF